MKCSNERQNFDFPGEKRVTATSYTTSYLEEAVEIIRQLDRGQIDAIVHIWPAPCSDTSP